MLFWRRWVFFHWLFDNIDVENASKFVAGKHRILTTMNISGSCVIHTVIVLCLPLPSVRHWSFISKSSENWRQDLFQKWKLYRRTWTPSCLLSISGVIRILMRVIRLTNGKPCRCYNTCGYLIFMSWVFYWITCRSYDKYTIYTGILYSRVAHQMHITESGFISARYWVEAIFLQQKSGKRLNIWMEII